MTVKNGCIFMISARKQLLHICLQYLNDNYNKIYNYPILIFYHGNKYDDNEFIKSIENINVNTKYTFHKIYANIPDFLHEKDLFWNLPNNRYAKKFTKDRLGYLHANYFWNNFMNFKELQEFDYMMRIDDDSWFKNEINLDLFDELDRHDKLLGCAFTWNTISQNTLETRFNLFKWVNEYVDKYNVNIKTQSLKKYLKSEENDKIGNIKYNKDFHSMNYLCGNCNIYNRRMFQTKEWNDYLYEFNKIAGGYRYRWGDCEIISIFYYLHIGEDFLDLDLKNKNMYTGQIDDKWNLVKDKDLF